MSSKIQCISFIQDVARGDSGSPLYTLGDNSTVGETSGQYLIGILSGGKDGFVAKALKRGNLFFPKYWTRVSVFRGPYPTFREIC